MKKILLFVAICATGFVQQTFAQNATPTKPSELLHSYYDIKDALVAGNATTASMHASEFVKAANSMNSKDFSVDTRNELIKYAEAISATKDIKHQREHFAPFSTKMATLAKAVKLSDDPIYEAYCPMKKSYWLSSAKVIKNPYFGSAMLTCGKITETIQ